MTQCKIRVNLGSTEPSLQEIANLHRQQKIKKIRCWKNHCRKHWFFSKYKIFIWFGYLLFPVKKMRLFCMLLFLSRFDINFVVVVSKGVLFSASLCAKWIGNWPMDLPSYFYFSEYFHIRLAMKYWCLKWMLPQLRLILHHVISSCVWFAHQMRSCSFSVDISFAYLLHVHRREILVYTRWKLHVIFTTQTEMKH